MERVLGVETEYGLSARTARGRLSAPEAAEMLFRPLVAEHSSANAFLRNGGRLYLDVGAHPEYATPECRTVGQLLVAERAGDEIVARLARRASELAAAGGQEVRFRLFKNNVDSFGNSYGCHENYLVARDQDLSALVETLTPFLVTRQVLCGAGSYRRGEFLISQRADHLHDQLSAQTTRARPLVNTRDEPLADPRRFRRLHVLAGDSNRCEPSAWLKVGTAEAVLSAVEAGGPGAARLRRLTLAEPAAAIRRVARDPLARLELAGGGSLTAVALQREYLEAAAEATEPALAGLWDEVLTALAAQEPERVATEVEWVAKRTLLGRFRRRHGLAADDPRLAQLGLAFHELGGVFTGIEAGGVVRRLTSPEQVRRAIDEPPADTRAAARGAFVDALQGLGRDHSVDWRTCTVHDLPGPDGARRDRTITLDDPLCADSEELTELIAELVGDRSPRATDGSGRSTLPG